MEKGEIAHLEQFLLFTQCFQKDLLSRHVKTGACSGKGSVFTRQPFVELKIFTEDKCGSTDGFISESTETSIFALFLCPHIERSGADYFAVVRLSVRPSVCTNLT